MATEDFSFPIITNAYPYNIDSPPLWQTSPAASPSSFHVKTASKHTKREEEGDDDDDDDEDGSDDDCFLRRQVESMQRKSCSSAEKGSKSVKIYNSEDEEEEKMDSLWEDFNIGELSRSYSSKLESSRRSTTTGDMVALGCVQGLRLSKTNGAIISPKMVSPRRPGIMVFVKVLKKLFLLHNYHPTVKKRAW